MWLRFLSHNLTYLDLNHSPNSNRFIFLIENPNQSDEMDARNAIFWYWRLPSFDVLEEFAARPTHTATCVLNMIIINFAKMPNGKYVLSIWDQFYYCFLIITIIVATQLTCALRTEHSQTTHRIVSNSFCVQNRCKSPYSISEHDWAAEANIIATSTIYIYVWIIRRSFIIIISPSIALFSLHHILPILLLLLLCGLREIEREWRI